MARIVIGKHEIDSGRTFIIAEAGVNHNGDPSIARALIDAAAAAGADAVKFQTFVTEDVITRAAPKATYQTRNTRGTESQFEMIKRLELSREAHFELASYASQRGITFLSSPFDEGSVDLLGEIGVPAIKIASGEIVNWPLLQKAASLGRPMIVSSGMSTLGEVEQALRVIHEAGNQQVVLLHCTSNYPTSFADAHLRVMDTLKRAFSVPVGYSDHTIGISVPVAAVARGATVIEKHFTLDKTLPGPDHVVSLEPSELAGMVRMIREVEMALGDQTKRVLPAEEEIRSVARKSIVAARELVPGMVLDRDSVAFKRPGNGIYPKDLERVLGRTVLEPIHPDQLIRWDQLGGKFAK
ncbi:MAG: N-acetylneuraminate synthase [Symbiobacteriia bacterium]